MVDCNLPSGNFSYEKYWNMVHFSSMMYPNFPTESGDFPSQSLKVIGIY